MTEPSLSRLHIDTLEHKCRGCSSPKVMEHKTSEANSSARGQPYTAPPLRVIERFAARTYEYESISVGARQSTLG
jgi:hypothetical protein